MNNEKVERNQEIVKLYESGMSTPELGRRFGVMQSRIITILHSRGVQMRSSNDARLASEFVKNQTLRLRGKREQVCELYRSGKTGEEIASFLEISTLLVWKYLKESGLKIRVGNTNSIPPFWLKESAEKFYILGYLFADGNVASGNYSVRAQSNDKNDLQRMAQISGGNFYMYKNYGCVTFGGKILGEYLGQYGLVPRKSRIMKFPQSIPAEFMMDFIRGYFDGDGCITTFVDPEKGRRCRFGFSSGSLDFLLSVQDVLMRVDIDGGKIRDQRTEWGQVYQLTYEGVFRSLKMRNYLYYEDCFCLDRKREKFISIKEPIEMISKTGKVYYRHAK